MGSETEVAQKVHSFCLIYAKTSDLPEPFEDPLFEAGCDDSTILIRDGLLQIDFDREAPSFREALLSAIEAVEHAALPILLIRVEPIEGVPLLDGADVSR